MNEIHPERIRDVYEWHTQVASYDVGPDRLLTPAAQLRLQQEAGERHFGEGGLHFEGIAAMGMAFLVLENNAVIHRRPAIGEKITVKTWSRNIKGLRFFRCYRFEDEAGSILIDSVASFALVDLNTHMLLRPSAFPVEVSHQPDLAHTCPDPSRIVKPAESEPCGQHTVVLSELDFNGHLNNTRYADILFDVLPPDTEEHMHGFSVTFAHEARHADVLALSRARDAEGNWTVTAQNGEQTCFMARVIMK